MQEIIVLKIKYNDDIRRVRFIEKGFVGLQKQIGEIYSIQQGTFTLKYRDDEGDLVTISSEEEFSESFKFIQNNILRLEITSLLEGEGRCKRRWKGKCHKGNRDNHHGHRQQHQGQNQFGFLQNITKNLIGDEGVLNNLLNSGLCHIEHNYVCDGCNSKIRGTRYHCSECPDFDFCSSCHETKLDSHPQHKFVAITALDALKEAIGNGEQIETLFEFIQPGQAQQQQGSTSNQENENEILEQERHKQQIEQERIEQEQERIKQEQQIEQERLQQEQERIKQEQEKVQQEQQVQEEPKNVDPLPEPQPNKTFFENFKDILFPLRNPEPVNNETFEKKLEDLTYMGFDKKECIKALVQNKGNMQRAIDALLKKK